MTVYESRIHWTTVRPHRASVTLNITNQSEYNQHKLSIPNVSNNHLNTSPKSERRLI